jgi:hypothetical protein
MRVEYLCVFFLATSSCVICNINGNSWNIYFVMFLNVWWFFTYFYALRGNVGSYVILLYGPIAYYIQQNQRAVWRYKNPEICIHNRVHSIKIGRKCLWPNFRRYPVIFVDELTKILEKPGRIIRVSTEIRTRHLLNRSEKHCHFIRLSRSSDRSDLTESFQRYKMSADVQSEIQVIKPRPWK